MILLAAFLGAWAWLRFGFYLHGVRQLDAASAKHMVEEEGALIVDVREKAEYKTAHIPGSRNLPLSRIRSELGKLERYRDRPIIVGCRSGSRSRRASVILKKGGFNRVYNLKGGVIAWGRAMRKGKMN